MRILKTKRNVSLLRFSPIFGPKLGEDQKKRSSLRFSSGFGPKLGEDQKLKKRFSLRFSPVFGPKLGEDLKQKSSVTFCPFVCSNFEPNLQRPCHHAPPKNAPDWLHIFVYLFVRFRISHYSAVVFTLRLFCAVGFVLTINRNIESLFLNSFRQLVNAF